MSSHLADQVCCVKQIHFSYLVVLMWLIFVFVRELKSIWVNVVKLELLVNEIVQVLLTTFEVVRSQTLSHAILSHLMGSTRAQVKAQNPRVVVPTSVVGVEILRAADLFRGIVARIDKLFH